MITLGRIFFADILLAAAQSGGIKISEHFKDTSTSTNVNYEMVSTGKDNSVTP